MKEKQRKEKKSRLNVSEDTVVYSSMLIGAIIGALACTFGFVIQYWSSSDAFMLILIIIQCATMGAFLGTLIGCLIAGFLGLSPDD